MKKLLTVLLAAMLLTGCAAADTLKPSALDRETVLPVSFVSDLAGAPMKLACDRRSDQDGRVIWAWEEEEGAARLIYLELYLPPADSEALYTQAAQGADMVIETVANVRAVGNQRATFARYGDFYLRIVMLGVEREQQQTAMLIDWLAGSLGRTEE